MRFRIFAIIAIVLFAAAASGCVLKPAPPAPSPTPLPSPTAEPPKQWPPSTIGTITSSQVAVKDVKVAYSRDIQAMQAENFSIRLENSGRTWANNTFLTLRVTDAQTDQYYFSKQYNIGNMSPRSSRWLNLTTGTHDYGFSVLVQMDYYWGDDLEFHNTYKKAYTLAPVDPDHIYK